MREVDVERFNWAEDLQVLTLCATHNVNYTVEETTICKFPSLVQCRHLFPAVFANLVAWYCIYVFEKQSTASNKENVLIVGTDHAGIF